MSVESDRAMSNEVESSVPASKQEAAHSVPILQRLGTEARDAFFQMINQLFTQFTRVPPSTLQPQMHPPPSIMPLVALPCP